MRITSVIRGRVTAAVLLVLVAVVFWIRSDVFFNIARAVFGGGAARISADAVRRIEREVYFSGHRNLAVVFYLADDAARRLRDGAVGVGGAGWLEPDFKRLASLPTNSKVIFVSGSGTYHHHTLRFISEISRRPGVLYLIDAHSDARPSGRSDCGSWVGSFDGDIVFLGGYFGLTRETMRWLDPALLASGRLKVYAAPNVAVRRGYVKINIKSAGSAETLGRIVADFRADRVAGFFGKPGAWVRWKTTDDFLQSSAKTSRDSSRVVHLSIDLDVLSARHIDTGWGNGELNPADVVALARAISRRESLLSADICGWSGDGKSAPAAFKEVFRALVKEMSSHRGAK
ncbi:MAG: hypothetical protein QME32_03195 [Endomicrobiia bacterium]|nr:hypothetical protein [Endomicrobiia bacterium]